jgi:hypothetical protein
MADQVQFTADGSQVFDVISRLQSQLANLENRFNRSGGGGDKFGESFLRSERIVSRSSANMVTGLLQANNAADALANALLQIEHSTKLGLGLAVGAAVGIALFETFSKQLSAVKKAEEELQNIQSVPLNLIGGLDAAGINKTIGAETAKLEAFEKATGNFAGTTEESSSGFGARFGAALAANFSGKGAGIGSQRIESVETERVAKIAEAQARIREEGELRLVAEQGVVKALNDELHISSSQAALDKARAEAAKNIAQLQIDARNHPNPVLAQEVQLEKEKLALVEQQIQRKASKEFQAQGEAIRQTDLANFHGTTSERTDRTLASNLAAAERERDQFAFTNLEKEKATEDVAKAQLAIYERQIQVKREISDLHFATKVDSIKNDATLAAAGAGPEATQRINLEAAVRVSDELRLKAAQRATQEHLSAKSMQDFNQASSQAVQSHAALAKFENERAFANKQELQKATTENQATSLKDQGRKLEATLLTIREQTEAKIAQHLRDQKGELAKQDLIAGQLALKEAAKAALRNPQGAQAEQRQAAAEEAQFQRKIQYFKDQIGRGIKFDKDDPTVNIIKQYLADKNNLAVQGSKGQKDFAGIASLAGLDFKDVAALAGLKFDGIKALAGLTISVVK